MKFDFLNYLSLPVELFENLILITIGPIVSDNHSKIEIKEGGKIHFLVTGRLKTVTNELSISSFHNTWFIRARMC